MVAGRGCAGNGAGVVNMARTSPYRVFASANPMAVSGPLLPMTDEDRRIWQIQRARLAAAASERLQHIRDAEAVADREDVA